MQEKHLFEYAIVRLVPCVEREEFVNVGVVVYCRERQFLKSAFELNETRVRAVCAVHRGVPAHEERRDAMDVGERGPTGNDRETAGDGDGQQQTRASTHNPSLGSGCLVYGRSRQPVRWSYPEASIRCSRCPPTSRSNSAG